MILPWHQSLWQRLHAEGGRGHHALLLAGPAGGGKRAFAEQLARARLCDHPGPEGYACGQCEACTWNTAGTHPDLFHLVPEADDAGAEDGGEAEAGAAKSRQIKVDQVRAVQEALTRTGHRDARRVVLVDPAEAMNAVTANGLLKLLEEPPQGVLFLLVSGQVDRLLPTVRSRCQRWDFPAPNAADAQAWLQAQGLDDAGVWLGFAGGMPVAARDLAGGPLAAIRTRFVRDVGGLPGREPVQLAGEWDAWLRAKDTQAAGFDMPRLANWLLRWQTDLVASVMHAPLRFFPDAREALDAQAKRLDAASALGCYNDALNLRRVAAHPLNARLVLEDMLLRFCRHFASVR